VKATFVKSGTTATADAKATTKQIRNHRRTHEGNAIVPRVQETKQSKIKEKDLYTLVKKKESSKKLTKAMKLQKKR